MTGRKESCRPKLPPLADISRSTERRALSKPRQATRPCSPESNSPPSLSRKGEFDESSVPAGPADLRRLLPLQRSAPFPGAQVDGAVRRFEERTPAGDGGERHRSSAPAGRC